LQADLNRLRKTKLVVCDLDGTLLNDNGELGSDLVGIVKRLQNEFGVMFSIATGRMHSSVADYCNELGINIPVISLDGALIQDVSGTQKVFEAHIKKRHVQKILKLASRYLIKASLCHADEIYYTEDNEPLLEISNKPGAKYTLVNDYSDYTSGVLEVFLASDNEHYIKNINNRLSFPYTLGVTSSCYRSMRNKGVYYLEARKNGCTKKTGLFKLLRHLRTSQNKCVVVGDWYNDRPLFETKAYKVAMANAVSELKYLADYETETDNNNHGAANFFELLLKAKMEK